VSSKTGVPEFLFGVVLTKIEEHLKKKLSVNMMEIDLKKEINRPGMEKIPILFLVSKDDKLVRPIHVETLFEMHRGEKILECLEGPHNKPRSAEVRELCASFLCNRLSNENSQVPKQQPNTAPRKYSEDTMSSDPKPKILSPNYAVGNNSQDSPSMEEHSNNFAISNNQKLLFHQSFVGSLVRKSKQGSLASTYSTSREEHSPNKSSSSKISLSQLKKNLTNGDMPLSAKCSQLGFSKEFKKQSKVVFKYKNSIKDQTKI
jgi:hypothetical protein